jgi:putative ABC transport system permease protein
VVPLVRWSQLDAIPGAFVTELQPGPIARGIAGTRPYVPLGLAVPLAAGAVLLCLTATGLPAGRLTGF